jgi:ribosomal protein S18 acetylase RimI-like enzyme
MGETPAIALPSPHFDGMTWRAPIESDAPAIAALHDACFEADDTYRMVESEMLEHWDSTSLDPSTDALVGFSTEGELVVVIWTILPDGAETKRRAYGYENRIHPTVRSERMSDFVLAWWEARARQRFAAIDDDLPRVLFQSPFSHLTDEIDFYISRGYEIVRYFHELGRDLSAPIKPIALRDGIEFRTLEGHKEDARLVHNDSFRDHWGSQPVTAERWSRFFNESFMPEASFVAYEEGAPVAYLTSAKYPQDFDDRGWPHAWVEGVGTARSHRRMGLASALITKAMGSMVEYGMEYALLGVDADNPTGAYGLYESLGFTQLRGEVMLSKEA